MKCSARPWRLAGMLAGVAALLTQGGCADNNQSFYVVANGQPDNSCLVSAQEGGPTRSSGVLDLLVGTSYNLYPLLKNVMSSSLTMHGFNEADGRLEAHNVYVKKAIVDLSYDPNIMLSDSTAKHREITISGTVGVSGIAAITVELIDAQLVARLNSKIPQRSETEPRPGGGIVADVQIEGVMGDGTAISSNVFSFPLRVCRGCLLDYPLDADNPATTELDCSMQGEVEPVVPCRMGQDEPVDCRLCKRIISQEEQDQCEPM